MPNKNYERGRRAEYKTCKALRAVGYDARRSAGSHGCWDVIGIRGSDIRLVQVKRSEDGVSGVISEMERESFSLYEAPQCCTKEIWTWIQGQREPLIEPL